MPYALASPVTTASVDGLAASMLFQTKLEGVKIFKPGNLSLYRENKIVIEWTRTLLSKYYSRRNCH